MKLTHKPNVIQLNFKNNKYSFLESGNIHSFMQGNLMINGYFGNLPSGSANNLWLRIYNNEKITFYPLLGIGTTSKVSHNENSVRFDGTVANLSYTVTFHAVNNIWFWDIDVTGDNETIDIVYGQDIGLALEDNLLENELYTAQYLGHSIFEGDNGYVVCSRQNLPQNDSFPYLQQGMLKSTAVAYSTDSFQFFGKSYKLSNLPEVLTGDLPSINLQFEGSYTGLQSEKVTLSGSHKFVFYGIVMDNHSDAITQIEYTDEINNAFLSIKTSENYAELQPVELKNEFGSPYVSPQWNLDKLNEYYPERCLEEFYNGDLISFFTPDKSHILVQQKELLVERPHGNIITTLINPNKVDNNLISSTNYINGIFNSQTVLGNTTMHKLLSTPRGLLDFFKTSGQRIWIKLQDTYQLLTLPAIFEMGLNYSRWYYDIGTDTLVVTAFAKSDSTEIILDVKSKNSVAYDFILTNQLVLGKHEYRNSVNMEVADSISISPCEKDWSSSPYPNLNYNISLPNTEFSVESDSIFYTNNHGQNDILLCVKIKEKACFQLNIKGDMEKDCIPITKLSDFDNEKEKYIEFYKNFMSNFNLTIDNEENYNLQKLNTIMLWYTHNALVHYAVPHGLEQSGGAAWGTRDVSQGPMELFLSTQNYDLARDVIINLFSHQFSETGEWPQWFMFDKYKDAMEECHGDVVFWPLKCISSYIDATNDIKILDETLPYIDDISKNDISKNDDNKYTLLSHVKLAVSAIEKRFLKDTFLISYAGGDWDDTLQPANNELKENLVSSWTQALAYQVLQELSNALSPIDTSFSAHLKDLANNVKASFLEYLVIDGVVAGFVYRTSENLFIPMLHPQDNETGINYRLIPMTRSVLSDIVDVSQANNNLTLIKEHLHCPDGVRLMNKPAKYTGGISKIFLRAERAANIGREVSLQYTHAHIRYIEALCHLGKAKDVWSGLFEVNPINISEVVPRALLRQSNLYFTSSDGAFNDRYEYAKDFDKLKEGTIDVKGGWRLYSSGPGIYIKNVIENVLGIGFNASNLIIDPVLDTNMDNLKLQFKCFDALCTFHYHINIGDTRSLVVKFNNNDFTTQEKTNPYRDGGVLISKELFTDNTADIHIYLTVTN